MRLLHVYMCAYVYMYACIEEKKSLLNENCNPVSQKDLFICIIVEFSSLKC